MKDKEPKPKLVAHGYVIRWESHSSVFEEEFDTEQKAIKAAGERLVDWAGRKPTVYKLYRECIWKPKRQSP